MLIFQPNFLNLYPQLLIKFISSEIQILTLSLNKVLQNLF